MPRSRIHHRQNDKLKKMPYMTRIQIITKIFPFNCYCVLAMQKLQVLNNEKIVLNDELVWYVVTHHFTGGYRGFFVIRDWPFFR